MSLFLSCPTEPIHGHSKLYTGFKGRMEKAGPFLYKDIFVSNTKYILLNVFYGGSIIIPITKLEMSISSRKNLQDLSSALENFFNSDLLRYFCKWSDLFLYQNFATNLILFYVFQLLSTNNAENTTLKMTRLFWPAFECAAPKCWSKFTTYNLYHE